MIVPDRITRYKMRQNMKDNKKGVNITISKKANKK